MKKIFTFISLVAVISMATITSVSAQKQQLTDKEKAAVCSAVVPEMFKQVKLISGIDFMALANPDIEMIISSPLFGTQSLLKAANPAAISIKPDSMRLDLSSVIDNAMAQGFLKDIKLTFDDYKEFSVTTAEGRAVNVNIPQQIVANIIGQNITLNIKLGDKTGLLPFSTLDATVDFGSLGSMLEQFMGIKGTNLIKITESSATGIYTYNVVPGDCLRSILKVAGMTEAEALPDFKINVDMTKMVQEGTIGASLKGVFTTPTAVELPMGDAKIYMNKTMSAADSTILTSYETGSIKIKGYKKIVSTMEMNEELKGFVYTTVDSVSADSKVWEADSITTIETTTNQVLDPKNMIASIFNGLIEDLMNVQKVTSFTMNVQAGKLTDDPKKPVAYAEVETSINGTLQNQQGNIQIKMYDKKDGAPTMGINIILPIKGETISAEFTSGADTKIGTMYIQSNAIPVVTGNEAAPALESVKVYAQEGGLYIENCDKATYSLISMNGSVLAHGVIASSNEYIAAPSLVKGNIYIVSVIKDNARKSFKVKAK